MWRIPGKGGVGPLGFGNIRIPSLQSRPDIKLGLETWSLNGEIGLRETSQQRFQLGQLEEFRITSPVLPNTGLGGFLG